MTLEELRKRTIESLARANHSIWEGVLVKVQLDIPSLEETMLIDSVEKWLAANEETPMTAQPKPESYWQEKRLQILSEFDVLAMEFATVNNCSIYEAVMYCVQNVKRNHLRMAIEMSQPRTDGIIDPHRAEHIENAKLFMKKIYGFDVTQAEIDAARREFYENQKLIERVN